MKKLLTFFTLATFALTSCSSDDVGPQGPPGPPGPPGEDGLVGIVFDIEGDFTEDNNYSLEAFYEDFTDEDVFETDVVHVYLLTGNDGEAEGEPVDIWSPLPQTRYVDGGGSMQYNYDYTYFSTYIYLDGDVDVSTLNATYTDNQVFRIAILPATFASDNNIDVANYDAVMSALKVNEREVPTVKIKQ
ncbi:hypothetical protein GCM10007103_13290 [Salinimicrobium marinum]|uniref:Collagen-like protein n=1 Tax=Salinimicrobium marinum TaxID=680283 RepID=A0A918SAS1_9FLAO|nr:collagen-like protein [Salinimicrobium marinum]GHA33154.1 hypothetical protein GCM10007103_13290 [Salinimicrobium marinum]